MYSKLNAGTLSAVALSLMAAFSTVQAAPGQVYVNLFEWKYSDIAKECNDYLGPKGFSAVQISVPSEAKQNERKWWERYQPASYKIVSRSGNADDLKAMITTCRDAGVAIYADVVLNHLANGTGTGMAGSGFSEANSYNGVPFGPNDFHEKKGIDYGNEGSIQFGWMGDNGKAELPDLKTESDYVRGKLSDYLRELLSLGVAGFRFDAAKHIPADDLKIIVDGAGPVRSDIAQKFGLTKPWVTHEVFGGWDAISSRQQGVYFSIGSGTVNEFKYRDIMRQAFDHRGTSVSSLFDKIPTTDQRPNPWGFMPSYLSTVFIDNHDTERHNASMNYSYGAKYNLANIFMLAYPYGQPQLMSGFKINYSSGTAPNDQLVPTEGAFNGNEPNTNQWIFTHRWPEIGNMVEWRNQAQSVWRVDDWTTDGADRVAFHRGDKAFVAINNTGDTWQNTFKTGLADGTYCNVVDSLNPTSGTCPDNTKVTVSGGQATLSIKPNWAAAFHVGSKVGGGVCDNPNDFGFASLSGVAKGSQQSSNVITVSGLSCNAALNVSGGLYSLNGGAFTAAPATVKNGDTLQLQVQASSNDNTATSASLTVGKDNVTFTVSTGSDACTGFCPSKTPVDYDSAQLVAGQTVTLYYKGALAGSSSLKIHQGVNGWKGVQDLPMNKRADGYWEAKIALPQDAKVLDFVFTNGSQWDNNSNADWHLTVKGSECISNCGGQATVSFKVTANTLWGESVYITGNQPELGNWSAAIDSKRLCQATAYPEWTCTITFASSGKAIEYKYLKLGLGTKWESGANRTYTVPAGSSQKSDGSFRN